MDGCGDNELPECEVSITEGAGTSLYSPPELKGSSEVLRHFIETYESLPGLWNPSDLTYQIKSRRNAALEQLRSIYVQIKPGATVDDVRKKINTLRTNYWKEMKKVMVAKEAGEVYEPTSWVFHAMKFLNSCEQILKPKLQLQSAEPQHDDGSDTSLISQDDVHVFNVDAPQTAMSSRPSPILPPQKKQRMSQSSSSKHNGFSSSPLLCHYLEEAKESHESFPTIAKVWGEKLLTLNPEQRLFAEKAINDVLFEATLGSLHRDSVKINGGYQNPYQ